MSFLKRVGGRCKPTGGVRDTGSGAARLSVCQGGTAASVIAGPEMAVSAEKETCRENRVVPRIFAPD